MKVVSILKGKKLDGARRSMEFIPWYNTREDKEDWDDDLISA